MAGNGTYGIPGKGGKGRIFFFLSVRKFRQSRCADGGCTGGAWVKKNRPIIGSKGFTLIELVVVIVLINMMFAFALPKMDGFLFVDNRDRVSRWVILKVDQLKNLAVQKQVPYVLHVDTKDNMFWVSQEGMDEEALDKARQGGYKLPDNIRLEIGRAHV
jgi:prepilin-type N-terminal cleavage/methylation domain-containing protein